MWSGCVRAGFSALSDIARSKKDIPCASAGYQAYFGLDLCIPDIVSRALQ